MRVKKTRSDQRNVYRYPVDVPDGKGGYRTTYNIIKPGDDGTTEVLIHTLNRWDDNWITNIGRNGHPKLTEQQKADKKAWEEEHPGEKYPMNWNLSIESLMDECVDGDVSKSSILAGASYDPFADMDDSDDVLKLREIIATKMTDRQKQAIELIGLEGYTITEAAEIMGISIKVAKVHYDKAVECIKKNF
ncbi:MAG: sigma-70 family RNA polymerase sigma factor [Lachnospiraceae bacterium]|nr:sigma-70 family RNA polymerase sigma factor [Lachnospiraceae bacterium]